MLALQLFQEQLTAYNDFTCGSNLDEPNNRGVNSSSSINSSDQSSGNLFEPQYLSLKSKVAAILIGLWQFYEHFLPHVRKFQDALREPTQVQSDYFTYWFPHLLVLVNKIG